MWTGKAIIRPGWAVFLGTAGDHTPHRHHAVQLAVGLRGPIGSWAQEPGRIDAPGAVIAADCAHRLDSGPDPILLCYLEREFTPGRRLDDWCAGAARALSAEQAHQVRLLLGEPEHIGTDTLDALVALIAGDASPEPAAFSDARIARSLAALPRPLPGTLTVTALAAGIHLSPSRYAHLFRAHTGMPLRPYLRWLRLQQALSGIARGANLTAAAHAAGFSDSAHLSRSFRSTFGIAPSALLHPSLSLQG